MRTGNNTTSAFAGYPAYEETDNIMTVVIRMKVIVCETLEIRFTPNYKSLSAGKEHPSIKSGENVGK